MDQSTANPSAPPDDREAIARKKLQRLGAVIGAVTLLFAVGVVVAIFVMATTDPPTPQTYAPPVPGSINGIDVDPAAGRQLFAQNCASCHGKFGEGMIARGVNLRESAFVQLTSDSKLLKFLHVGRKANDPNSILKIEMPAKGANPLLGDQELGDLVAYMRQIQIDARRTTTASTTASTAP
ncbi:MAG TPA: cytochrome c [Tepidisphaeraceae bacterium]|nr:cytochrome c [Tepidisphaeraceae bacterium]